MAWSRRPTRPVLPPINEAYLAATLDGMHFPASPWQMLAWAARNGARAGVQVALGQLPGQIYHGVAEVVEEINRARDHGRTDPPER
jgi:hypothetical protein